MGIDYCLGTLKGIFWPYSLESTYEKPIMYEDQNLV